MSDHSLIRHRLPATRESITKKKEACGFEYYVIVSFWDRDSAPGEVFIKIAKQGTEISGVFDALMVTLSMALQYGVPWDILRDKYLHTRFGTSDPTASSILDAVARTIDEAVVEREAQVRVWNQDRDEGLPPSGSPQPAGGPGGGNDPQSASASLTESVQTEGSRTSG